MNKKRSSNRIYASRDVPLIIASLILMCVAHPALAQFDQGQLSGFVRDQQNAAIPAATVKLTNIETKLDYTTTTDESGYYVFVNLSPGIYSIAVELPGFKTLIQTNIKVDAASKASLDLILQPGNISESITVSAVSAVPERDTGQIAKTIEAKDIQDLMLNGRNPISLALLKAGVRGGSFNAFQPDNLTTGAFSINGSRNDENLITIDGVIATRTRSAGAIIGTPIVDAIQEVRILTSSYLPEYGRSSGGQIRFVTKSGGREFHGGVFEFFRNSSLDTNNWTRNSSMNPDLFRRPAPFKFNQFGYHVGGPILMPGKGFNQNRDRLFFFWAQEWITLRREATGTATVPTQRMRQGDFSELLDAANPFFGRTIQILDPQTGQPFPGNIIPKGRLSPNGIAFLNVFPLPTPGFQRGSANWIGTSSNPRDTRKDTIKIDYQASSKDMVSFRGSNFNWEAVDPFRGSFDLARTDWSRPNKTAASSWARAFSPTLINEFTFGFAADWVYIDVFDTGKFQRSAYGINFPYIFPGTKDIEDKIPSISISGFGFIDGGPYPAFSSGPIYTWSDIVTKTRKRHTIKAGVFIEYSGENDLDQINVQALPGDTNNQNGRFEFTDNRTGGTGLAVANVALGLFTNYGEIGTKAYTPWRALAVDLFFQDSWKVRDNLSIEYGVRYCYWPPWHSLWNNIAIFDPRFYDPTRSAVIDPRTGAITSGDRFNGIVLPGRSFPKSAIGRVPAASDPQFERLFHDLPRGFSETHKNVFEPRLGLAYSINDKSVVRVGVGVFHNRVTLNDSTLLGGNPPIQFKVGVTNGQADAPAGGVRRDFPFIMTTQDRVFKHPTAYDLSLAVQRELLSHIRMEAAYVGRIGTHLQRERNINQLKPGTIQANSDINPNALRPYKGYSIIRLSENAGRSFYNGFQLSVDRRFSSGLGFGLAYTLSKVTSNADDKRTVLFNAYDDRGFKGISDLDRTHVFNLYYIYELPFWRAQNTYVKKVLGRWQISGVTFYQSGQPLSVFAGDDRAGVGETTGQPWDLVGNPHISKSRRKFSDGPGQDNNFWFDPKAFAEPAPGTFGNAGRNILRGPGFQSWDIALFKNVALGEGKLLQLRSEFFNFPNHPNWNNPSTDPKSPVFGRVTSKSGERNVQLALKYVF